jgi:hypothetical protein
VQREAAAEIAAGKPVAYVLAAAGLRNREPPRFDDQILAEVVTRLGKLLDLRAAAFGGNDAYRQARDQLDLLRRAVSRWRTERLNEPVPVIVDAYGRRVPIKVVPAFQAAEEIQILCGQLDAIARQVEGLARRPGGDLIQIQGVLPRLHDARKVLGDAQATAVCPCGAATANCPHCRGRGWLPVRG